MTDARKLLERCWDEWGSNTDEHDDPVTQELARDLRKFLDAETARAGWRAQFAPCPCGDQERPGHPMGWCTPTRAESDAKLLGEALEYTKGKLERTEEELRLARLASARSLRMTAMGALKDTLGLSGEVKPDGTIEVSPAEAERLVRDGLITLEPPRGATLSTEELKAEQRARSPHGWCVHEGFSHSRNIDCPAPPSPAEKLSEDE